MKNKFLLSLISLVTLYIFTITTICLFIYSLWFGEHLSVSIFVAFLLDFFVVFCVLDTIKFVKNFKNLKGGK